MSIAWLFDQQADTCTEAALDALVGRFAVAPRWWHLEVLNVLLTLERLPGQVLVVSSVVR